MSDTSEMGVRPHLGVGSLIGDSFSVVLQNLVPMTIAVAGPVIVGILLTLSLVGVSAMNPMAAMIDPDAYLEATAGAVEMSGIVGVLSIFLWCFAAAAVTRIAFDAKLGRPMSIGAALSAGAKRFLPLVVVSIVMIVLVYLVIVVATVPALLIGSPVLAAISAIGGFVASIWVFAVWSVFAPSVIVEGRWFGALGRSARLTAGYRWAIVGLMVVFFLLLFLISMLSAGLGFAGASMGAVGIVFSVAVNAIMTAFFYAVFSTLFALLYARLTEIKEGGSIEGLVEIFD